VHLVDAGADMRLLQSSRRNVTGVSVRSGVGLPGAGCSQKLSAALRRGKWSAGEPIAEF